MDPAGSGQPSPACAQKVGHQLHFSQCFLLTQLKSCRFPEAPKPHPALTAPSLMLCDRPMSGLPHLLPCHCYLLPWGMTSGTRASGIRCSPPHAGHSWLNLSGLPCYGPFCLRWGSGRKAGGGVLRTFCLFISRRRLCFLLKNAAGSELCPPRALSSPNSK